MRRVVPSVTSRLMGTKLVNRIMKVKNRRTPSHTDSDSCASPVPSRYQARSWSPRDSTTESTAATAHSSVCTPTIATVSRRVSRVNELTLSLQGGRPHTREGASVSPSRA